MQNQLGGKFSNGSVYIPTNITLNVCGLNVLIKKTEWQIGFRKKAPRTYNRLPTRESPQDKGHSQIESEGMEKNISCKWKQQENGSSDNYIRQIDVKQSIKKENILS